MSEHTEEAQDILMKWLMEDHTGEHVSIDEMHKVKKCIESLVNSHDTLLAACKKLIEANEYARAVSLRNETPRGTIWGEVRSQLDVAKLKAEQVITKAKS